MSASRERSARRRPAAALVTIVWAVSIGCTFAPYAPRDPNSLAPPGESEPVPLADPNPLDAPRFEVVLCTPQGTPVVESPETRACEQDPECAIRCREDAAPALDDAPGAPRTDAGRATP